MELKDPIAVRAGIKRMTANNETGERTIVLALPQSEAGKAAQLSLYDGIEFEVTFTPKESEGSFE